MKVFVINLAQAEERRNYISNLCQKYELDYEIIQAVEGKAISKQEYLNIVDYDKMIQFHKRELGLGELGCSLSHKKCYEKILEENLKYAVILEDDAYFDENLLEFLQYLNEFPKDLELLLLGHQRQVYNDDGFRIESPYSRRFVKKILNYKIRRLIARGNGTYGYFISKNGALKLLSHLEKIYLPIDALTCNEKVLNTYALFPVLIHTHENFMLESSTQDDKKFLKKKSKISKYMKKIHIFIKYFLPSLKKLEPYENTNY
ncbi:glycosyltransferase family 25 protein [Campylobacter canadensis]|uniref:Glycosyltransferase family 25 protein n=1 Tax=Campylobacter canadensis TaxID=449520 RepID=A0ABS7WS50_9BACT|nr:glycosyltransferase family 25 protein [Campylobacter canadensis]MBZ7987585.1 glycosyltransferase family 25 protein [Campylobacter canadensis]MBZ7998659.1 glycosyltransferase family 25 protein [Campylobacter canadensis]